MKVYFEKPLHGGQIFQLQDNEHEYTTSASYVSQDFIRELIAMLIRVWNGETNVCITYLIGSPYGLLQWLDNNRLRLSLSYETNPIPCTTDNKTLVEFNVTAKELCVAFWRGLRDLETKISDEEYIKHWGVGFPSDSLEILTNLIQQDKQTNDN